MADSAVFDWVCGELEQATPLNRIEARGTVRLALKQAGLDARSLSVEQMEVVLCQLLPAELDTRAVECAEQICRDISSALSRTDLGSPAGSDAPESVFERLGGGSSGSSEKRG